MISAKDRDGYTTTYEYDPLNLVTKIKYGRSKQVSFKYNQLGSLTERELPNGSSSQYGYNALAQLAQINPAGQLTNIYKYTYDAARL